MSKKTIYFHIGTHKTGTSAIQDFLALNQKVLKRKGFLFPQQSRRNYYTHTDDGYFVTGANHKSYQKLARLCRRKHENILISSETFSYLKNISDIRLLLDDLDVKIICYLRRQDSVVQSMYNQSVKGGGYYQDISEYTLENLDHFKLLENWASVFGRTNIIVRVYEKQQFVNHDLIADFLDALGLTLTDEFSTIKYNPNPRLSPGVLEYMRNINCLFHDKKAARKFKKLILQFSAQQDEETTSSLFFNHSLLSDDQQERILSSYQSSNALVAKEYLGRPDGQLFRQKPSGTHRHVPLQDILTDELFLEITRYLCKNRSFRKTLFQSVKQGVPRNDDFTKAVHSRFSEALTNI